MVTKKLITRIVFAFFVLFVPLFFIPVLLDNFKEYVLSISIGAWFYGLLSGLVLTRIEKNKKPD